MLLDMAKVKAIEGYKVTTNIYNEKVYGVVTIPAEGFASLVGYMLPNGTWGWVNKKFQKTS